MSQLRRMMMAAACRGGDEIFNKVTELGISIANYKYAVENYTFLEYAKTKEDSFVKTGIYPSPSYS